MNVCNTLSKKKIDFNVSRPCFSYEIIVFYFEAILHKAERTFLSLVSILMSLTDGHFVVIDTVSFKPLDTFSSGSQRKRKNEVLHKYYIKNFKNSCLSQSIKAFTLCT